MKYAIIIPDGGADKPLDALDGLTPFEAASTPNLDALTKRGRLGTVATTPTGFGAGSDICCMTLFGYDARTYHTGRAPLEAAALGIDIEPDDAVFRLNLVTTSAEGDGTNEPPGLMLDHSGGHISDKEARTLVGDLETAWRDRLGDDARDIELHAGVSYRNIVVHRGGRSAYFGDEDPLSTVPPHEIPREPIAKHRAEGGGSELLNRLMDASAEVFAQHEVNRARREQGLRAANMAWIWGQGTRPELPTFQEKFGVRGAIITAVDLLAGIAYSIGWDRLPVPGITGYHDTDYAAKGRYAAEALERYDLVVAHVEAPDEASHHGDHATKVASLESIDEHVIGPIVKKLESFGDAEADDDAKGWRVLVLPDHYTLVSTRKHDATPVPFALCGAWVRSVLQQPFSEKEAAEADLHITRGSDLMEYALFSGLSQARRAVKKS